MDTQMAADYPAEAPLAGVMEIDEDRCSPSVTCSLDALSEVCSSNIHSVSEDAFRPM